MVNILHATPKTNPWPLKNIAAIDNSSLNFRAQQKCLRSKLRPRHSGVRGFFVPLSPPEMNCLENDETDQCAATQSGCHGPALPAPPLFWFDIRRNMPHTDSLTFDVMSSRHTFQECQARRLRSNASTRRFAPNAAPFLALDGRLSCLYFTFRSLRVSTFVVLYIFKFDPMVVSNF